MKKHNCNGKEILGGYAPDRVEHNKVIVIKYGGSIMHNDAVKQVFIRDVALLKEKGIMPVIIHGGGKEISRRFLKLNMESEFLDGYRITKKDDIEEIEMILTGKISNQLLTSFAKINLSAIGISGKDMGFIKVDKKKSNHTDKDYGYVGEIKEINTEIITMLIKNGIVPIISPLGFDDNFDTYNINADDVASAISSSLKAEKLILLTDVDGLYREYGNEKTLIKQCNREYLKSLIDNNVLHGAILPKVKSCIDAIKNGVKSCHVVNGSVEHAILLELLTDKGIGTTIKEEAYEL